MWLLALTVVVGWICGFALFRKNSLPLPRGNDLDSAQARKLSVIVPARNEAANLPHLLESLMRQTVRPYEIIVADDCSEDGTKEIAERYGGVKVIAGSEPPDGWTGKNWAIRNGCLHATGDAFAFLDADVRLAPRALASLLEARERTKGVISVVPFHVTEKLYERLALVLNLLGIFAFTSVFERTNLRKGLYGSCIVALREDYAAAGGHDGVKSEVLDDLMLGSRFTEAGIPVANFLGCGLVSFRMYPNGIRSAIEGFGKGAVLSPARLSHRTVVLIALWVVGLLASETALLFAFTPWALPIAAGYIVYMLQLFYFGRHAGRFGIAVPVLHAASSLFFLLVMGYSLYRTAFRGQVRWKGRLVKTGGKRRP